MDISWDNPIIVNMIKHQWHHMHNRFSDKKTESVTTLLENIARLVWMSWQWYPCVQECQEKDFIGTTELSGKAIVWWRNTWEGRKPIYTEQCGRTGNENKWAVVSKICFTLGCLTADGRKSTNCCFCEWFVNRKACWIFTVQFWSGSDWRSISFS